MLADRQSSRRLNADPIRFDHGDPQAAQYADAQWQRTYANGDRPQRLEFDRFTPSADASDLALMAPVGQGGANSPLDVYKAKKVLHNAGAHEFRPGDEGFGEANARLATDIARFQRIEDLKVDGRIDPGGPTLHALAARAPGLAGARPPMLDAADFHDRTGRDPNRTLSGRTIIAEGRSLAPDAAPVTEIGGNIPRKNGLAPKTSKRLDPTKTNRFPDLPATLVSERSGLFEQFVRDREATHDKLTGLPLHPTKTRGNRAAIMQTPDRPYLLLQTHKGGFVPLTQPNAFEPSVVSRDAVRDREGLLWTYYPPSLEEAEQIRKEGNRPHGTAQQNAKLLPRLNHPVVVVYPNGKEKLLVNDKNQVLSAPGYGPFFMKARDAWLLGLGSWGMKPPPGPKPRPPSPLSPRLDEPNGMGKLGRKVLRVSPYVEVPVHIYEQRIYELDRQEWEERRWMWTPKSVGRAKPQ